MSKKYKWKPKADLIVRPRKSTLVYKMQLIKVSLEVENNKIVLVWTKWPARFVTDLQNASGIRCFTIPRPNNFYYVCRMEASCPINLK